MRRTPILLVSLAVLTALVAACGSTTGAAAANDIHSSVDRDQVGAGDAAPASAATAALAAQLYRHAILTEKGNVVFSPTSIEVALAMARVGAKGQTRAEMDRVLGAGGRVDLDRSLNALDAALAARNGERGVGDRKAEIHLQTADALWAQRDLRWDATFLDTLARNYGAGVNAVDYRADAEGARQRINSWTAARTDQKIPQVIPQGVLNGDTRFVLTNAVWFKAPWAEPFSYGPDAPFHKLDGTTANVRTMSGSGSGFGTGAGWEAASIPYLGDELEMVVIVPDDLAAFEQALDGPTLMRITSSLSQPVESVTMPAFRFRTALSLAEALSALGMPTAFSDAADLSGMTTDEKLVIAAVLHQAFIAVDDQGTEAAAATAVLGEATAAVLDPTRFVVDRPFVYVIRDRPTGAPVFMGRVVDPGATSD